MFTKRTLETQTSGSSPETKRRRLDDRLVGLFLKSIPIYKGNHNAQGERHSGGSYTIYTLKNLQDLVALAAGKKDTVKLRYILSSDFELLFALEGRPSKQVPPHYGMTGLKSDSAVCITAGNIKVNKEGEITFISNKSGDFNPKWDSVHYALAALFACNVPCAESMELEKLNGPHIENEVISLAVLKEMVADTLSEELKEFCIKQNESTQNKQYEYEKKINPHQFHAGKDAGKLDRLQSKFLRNLMRDEEELYLNNSSTTENRTAGANSDSPTKSQVKKTISF